MHSNLIIFLAVLQTQALQCSLMISYRWGGVASSFLLSCRRRALLNDNGLHGLCYGLYGLYGLYGPYGPYGLYGLYGLYGPYGPYGPYGLYGLLRALRALRALRLQKNGKIRTYSKVSKKKVNSPDLSGRQHKMLIHTVSNRYTQRSKKHLSITQWQSIGLN